MANAHWNAEGIEVAKAWGASQICPPSQAVLDALEWVAVANEHGLDVRVWLVTSPAMVPQLNDLGVYGGTVNFPDAAYTALHANN